MIGLDEMGRPWTIGSLFSGIGGLELGLEWAGLGPTKWQVEINPNARKVLAHHWPEAKLYEDVRECTGSTLAPVDIICGGFPCQDISAAGSHLGLQGSRSGLWYEFERIVSELRPEWVVVENVASGAQRWVDIISGGLERIGYACIPIPLAASDIGAPHQRARIFIVAQLANANRDGEPAIPLDAEVGWAPREARGASNVDGSGLPGRGPSGGPEAQNPMSSNGHGGWDPEPGLVPLVHGVSTRMASGNRREQIRLLGNAVVPQCAEVVGWVIRELAGDVP